MSETYQCQTCGEAAQSKHIDECDHCSIIASAWATDLNKLSKAEADNAALRKLLESCSEKLSYSIDAYDMELVNLIEQTLSKGMKNES